MLPALAGVAMIASAQVAPPAGAGAANAPADDLADDLAFAIADDRMTVPVSIAGAGPFRFVVDTGAQRSVISRELARRLGLSAGRSVRLVAMTGASVVETVAIPSLAVSTLGGRQIEAPALAARDLGAYGLLGVDTLHDHSVRIDFDRQVMAVGPAAAARRVRGGDPDEVVVRARSRLGQLVVTDAFVDNMRVRVVLDTGTAVSVGNEALRRRLAGGGRVTGNIELTSVTGEVLAAAYGSAARMRLGAVTMVNLPIAFADVRPFRVFGLEDKPAILLGMDALRLFRRVDIDFARREVRLLLPRESRRGLPPTLTP